LLNTYSIEKHFKESLLSVQQDIWKKEIRTNLDYMYSGAITAKRLTKNKFYHAILMVKKLGKNKQIKPLP
jgi:hypothetical protein